MRFERIRSRPRTRSWSPGRKAPSSLSGAVGTKAAHDAAVRLAIASGAPVRDDLVIDTGLAHAASVSVHVPGFPFQLLRFSVGLVSVYISTALDGQA